MATQNRSKNSKKKAGLNPRPLKKKAVVGRGMRDGRTGWNFTPLRSIAVVFLVIFGAIGLWQLVGSSADTTALTSEQCYNRGRVYNTTNKTCVSKCLAGAGTYTTSGVTFAYCSYALSKTVSKSDCETLYKRDYLDGSGGCARRWLGKAGDRVAGALQCKNNMNIYVLTTTYDYCTAIAPVATTPDTNWVWPVPTVQAMDPILWGMTAPQGIHKGIDIGRYDGTTLGKPVVAAHAGTVAQSYFSSTCGYMMLIKADTTPYWTGYQHLQTRNFIAGQYVKAGEIIGTVGKYGETTCGSSASGMFYHLHFSVENGNWISKYADDLSKSTNPCSQGILKSTCDIATILTWPIQ